eukprot:6503072-Pyramimonas_sp.AAC.1
MIQSAARGRAARRHVAAKRTPAPAAEEEEALPNLDDYTEDERKAIVQIQAAARGRASRKVVAAKKAGGAPAAAAVVEEAEALPSVDDFTEEERKKI